MSGNHHLYVPGPSNVPAAVQQAIHCPMEDHRNPTIPDLIGPLMEDMKKIVLTELFKRFLGPLFEMSRFGKTAKMQQVQLFSHPLETDGAQSAGAGQGAVEAATQYTALLRTATAQ